MVCLAGGGKGSTPVVISRTRWNKIADVHPAVQIKVCLYCVDLLFASASAILDNAEGSNRVTLHMNDALEIVF